MLTALQQANLAWEGVVTDMVESLTELLVCLINSSECDSTFGYGYFPKSWLVINRTLSDNICLGLLLELELDMMNCYQNLTTFRDQKTIILNTKIHLGYGFPCEPGTSKNQRLNDVRNNEKMKMKMMKPVLKAIKPLPR